MSDENTPNPSDDPPPQILYLNTDLDLIVAQDLNPLTSALTACGLCTLGDPQQGGDGQWYSVLEVNCCGEGQEPEETIRVMLDAIEAIDGEARQLWNECSKREFNIGYDCGDEPWAFNNGLSNETLARIASVGASLRITLYPQRPATTSVLPSCS